MLQGQKFQAGNLKLKNLMDAQMKYRVSAHQASGRPLEDIQTPYDTEIGTLEEDLNDAQNEYQLHQDNPMTASYKNKVKSYAGMSMPEQKLEEDLDVPDLETEMDNIINPKPAEPIMSEQPLSDPSEQITELQGNDIQPDDTKYGDPKILKYDSDGYPLVTEDVIEKPGHNVIAQNEAALIKKKQQMGQALMEQPPEEPIEPLVAEEAAPADTTPPSMEFMEPAPEMPYAPPPEDKEADIMMKNIGLLKTPPLKFKPEIYKGPKPEEYQAEPMQGFDRLRLIGKQIKDWGRFYGGKGFGEEGDTFYDKEVSRLDKYRTTQKADLAALAEKNRQSDQDAFQKFKYDQEVKYKMAVVDQHAVEKANRLKFDMIKMQYQKGKAGSENKQMFKMAKDFQQLKHVSNYPHRVDAFRNAMMAPTTGSGDKDIIENLVKFIDPQGVIREGKVKFMTSALKNFSMNPDGTANPEKLDRLIHIGLKGGFLSPEDRKELLEATIPMMQNFTRTYQTSYEQHKAVFNNRGWDANLLMPFETAVNTPEQVQGAKNKIYADYLAAKKEMKDFQDKRAANPDVTENKGLIGAAKEYLFGTEKPTEPSTTPSTKPPSTSSKIDEWEKKYGIKP